MLFAVRRSGPAVGGVNLRFFVDLAQIRLAVPIVLASVRVCLSDLEQYSGRIAAAVLLQTAHANSKTRENGRYRKSAGRCVGEAAANKEVQCCMLRARLLLSMAAPCVAALGASQVSA